jgi:peptidoglycan/xylan/chitin deacetylase (PgdA/CDA1 family)
MSPPRSLVLTFDDGPEPGSALESILQTLATNQITAEFYVIGSEVKSNPANARLIVQRGHKIQNHSWSHIHLDTASEASVRKEVKQTQEIIREVTGKLATKIRPPYGAGGWPKKLDPEIVKVAGEFGLKVENWDIDTLDWAAPQGIGSKKLADVRTQMDRHHGQRMVVLMHVQAATARDLPAFIEQARSWGYTFAPP